MLSYFSLLLFGVAILPCSVVFSYIFEPFDKDEVNFEEAFRKPIDDRFFEKMFMYHTKFGDNIDYTYEKKKGMTIKVRKEIKKGDMIMRIEREAIYDEDKIHSRNIAKLNGGEQNLTPEIRQELSNISSLLPMATVLLGHMPTPNES